MFSLGRKNRRRAIAVLRSGMQQSGDRQGHTVRKSGKAEQRRGHERQALRGRNVVMQTRCSVGGANNH